MLTAQRRKRRLARTALVCLSLIFLAALIVGLPAEGHQGATVSLSVQPSVVCK